MDDAQFETLVSRMESLQKRAPSAYKTFVLALAALGYAYLISIVLILLALTVGALWLMRASPVAGAKIALVVFALLWIVLKSLWVRLDPPVGEQLTRRDSPELFKVLDQLRAQLRAPRLHAVLVTADFNASISQVPRLGVFGWYRNYLCLGLPLMKCLTTRQFTSVLAHELGHLSRGHARTGNWIYRLRLVWQRLEAALEAHGGIGSGLIRRFFRWYIPYFVACSFPFARSNEFDADASALQLTSAREAGQALTNVSVMASYYSECYWPAIYQAAKNVAQPAFSPYTDLKAGTLTNADQADLQRWLMQALSQRTSHSDTHPSLTDRLAAIGVGAELALPGPGESADELLGEHGCTLQSSLDAQWRTRIADAWEEFYEQSQENRARLAKLRENASTEPLDAQTTLELANLEEQVGSGATTALALRREVVARDPSFALARFALARQLLEQGESEGVALMEGTIEQAPGAILAGSEILRNYWLKVGNHDLAKAWHTRFTQQAWILEEDRIERNQLRLSDTWRHHEIEPVVLDDLRAQLKKVQGLRRVYLVRKLTTHFPERPLYAVGFKVGLLRFYSTPRVEQIKQQLATDIRWPADTLILHVEGRNRLLGRKFRRTRGSRILG
jgi:Zn-dependent protease with chaperone function